MAYTRTNRSTLTDRINRVSWGGIIAGGLTAIAISFLLNLLGIGIGLSTIDPLREVNPFQGLGTGAAIWWVVSNIIALFAGGWVAGRTAGFPNKTEGGLHGFLAWALYSVVTFLFLTSTVSGIIGGVGSATSSLFGKDDTQRVVIQLERAQQTGEQGVDLSYQSIKNEILQLVRRGERMNILPEGTTEDTRSTLQNTRRDVRQAWDDLNLDANIERFFNNLSFDLDDNGNLDISVEGEYFDQVELKAYLAENTELTEAQIEGLITKWENNIDRAVQKAEQYYARAKDKVIQYADQAADALATFSIIAFIVLLVGAVVGFFGGQLGSPAHLVMDTDPNRTDPDRDVTDRNLTDRNLRDRDRTGT